MTPTNLPALFVKVDEALREAHYPDECRPTCVWCIELRKARAALRQIAEAWPCPAVCQYMSEPHHSPDCPRRAILEALNHGK